MITDTKLDFLVPDRDTILLYWAMNRSALVLKGDILAKALCCVNIIESNLDQDMQDNKRLIEDCLPLIPALHFFTILTWEMSL